MSQPTGYLPQKSVGHPADIQKPLTGQIHDIATDPGIQIMGSGWTTVGDPRAFEGSYAQSATANDKITLQYLGTSFWIRWRQGPDAGQVQVDITSTNPDGTTTKTTLSPSGGLDIYNSVAGYVITPFGFNLTRGVHTVTITVLGTKNVSSTAANVRVDMIMTDNEIGLHQVISMSEETVPTVISGGIPFLSIGLLNYLLSIIHHLYPALRALLGFH